MCREARCSEYVNVSDVHAGRYSEGTRAEACPSHVLLLFLEGSIHNCKLVLRWWNVCFLPSFGIFFRVG